MKKHRLTKRQRRVVERNGWARIKRSKWRPWFGEWSEMTIPVDASCELQGVTDVSFRSGGAK